MSKKELLEKIEEKINGEFFNQRYLLEEFLRLLFWHNYIGTHIKGDKQFEIFKKIDECTIEREDSIQLDTKKILPFINEIRKDLKLPELTMELHGVLMEIEGNIKKELMLKRLKDD